MTMHHGRAGKSVRDMATRRYFDLCLIGAGLLVCSLIVLSHLNTVAKCGNTEDFFSLFLQGCCKRHS